jgi:hypothetical protein
MKRAFCAIALVALLLGISPARSEQPRAFDIHQIRAALRITPAQEQYWAPVESVLRDIAQRHEAQQRAQANAGTMQRIRQRAVVIVLDSAAVARLTQAARPLANVLSEDQKRSAHELARRMGLGHMLAALR